LDLGNLPVCLPKTIQSMNVMVVSESGPLYYAIKITILNHTAITGNFDLICKMAPDHRLESLLVFGLLIILLSLFCGCVWYTCWKLCNSKNSSKKPSVTSSHVSLSINTDEVPLMTTEDLTSGMTQLQPQTTPTFYVLPPGFQPNNQQQFHQQYLYAYYPAPQNSSE